MKTKIAEFVITAALVALFCSSCNNGEASLGNFPEEADPVLVGNKLAKRFLEQGHSQYGSPFRANEPRTQITYPDVCVWLGGLWFAEATHNADLIDRLEKRFLPLFSTESHLQPLANHINDNVFGAIPLELYLVTKDERYKKMGMRYADLQWNLPDDTTLLVRNGGHDFETNPVTAREKEWAVKGYSWQTRIWIDDMYLLTILQAQAYRATGNDRYIDRAARQMVLYLDSLQNPDGLFYHGPNAPFLWGRGNGWMAVGMAELLRFLPESNVHRPAIMQAYIKMMTALKKYQKENGMWRQLIDDDEFWEETSGTAMFTYAMITGVKNKWLDGATFGPAARKGWLVLCGYVDEKGDVEAVCEGTDKSDKRQHYMNRRLVTGDLHGQAPVLWCAYALADNYNK